MGKKPAPLFLITLDFDGTLFGSPEKIATIPELKVSASEQFLTILDEYRSQGEFLPHSFCEFLGEKKLLNRREADRVRGHFLELQKNAKKYLYRDALLFLKSFPKDSLIIISRAHPDWQTSTIRSSGLYKKVSRVFIVQGDNGKRTVLEALGADGTPIFHFDDDPGDIARIKGIKGVLPVFVQRKHRREPYGFETLLDALEVVKPLLASALDLR